MGERRNVLQLSSSSSPSWCCLHRRILQSPLVGSDRVVVVVAVVANAADEDFVVPAPWSCGELQRFFPPLAHAAHSCGRRRRRGCSRSREKITRQEGGDSGGGGELFGERILHSFTSSSSLHSTQVSYHRRHQQPMGRKYY